MWKPKQVRKIKIPVNVYLLMLFKEMVFQFNFALSFWTYIIAMLRIFPRNDDGSSVIWIYLRIHLVEIGAELKLSLCSLYKCRRWWWWPFSVQHHHHRQVARHPSIYASQLLLYRGILVLLLGPSAGLNDVNRNAISMTGHYSYCSSGRVSEDAQDKRHWKSKLHRLHCHPRRPQAVALQSYRVC